MMEANGRKTRKHEQPQRARESSSAASVPPVAAGVALQDLQQSAGNRTVSEWLQAGPPLIQMKSNNGGSPDAAEQVDGKRVITLKDQDERMFNSFQACGYIGLAFAIGLAMALVRHQGLSYWIMIIIILTAVLTFLVLAAWSEFRTGRPRVIYYRYLLVVMGSVGALLLALGYPLLPYLDLTILGIGLFVVCGRIGCLMVGCCHGRPNGWGVTYSKESAAADFPEHLVGVRLFPVQAVESFWVLAIVLTGVVQVIGGQPSGSALSSYVVAYGLGRFCFEFLRGDARRRYFRGVSEAQWTSLLMAAAVVMAEWYGALPASSWHSLAVACLVIAILVINIAHATSDSSDSSKARIELCGGLELGRGN